MGQLFLRNKADVDVLLNVVGDHGLAMTRDAASFPDSLFGDALDPGTLNQELQTSQ